MASPRSSSECSFDDDIPIFVLFFKVRCQHQHRFNRTQSFVKKKREGLKCSRAWTLSGISIIAIARSIF